MSSVSSSSERDFIYSSCTQSPLDGFIGLGLFEGNYENKEETIRRLEIGKNYCDVLRNINNTEKALRIDGGSSLYEGFNMMFQFNESENKWKDTGENTYKIIKKALKSITDGSERPSQEEIKYCKKALKELSELAEKKLEILK